MNTNYKDKKTISGDDQEAFNEFLAGKERWNAYVEKHGDDTEVDFSGVDFPEHRKDVDEMYRQEGKPFDFSGYKFPKKGNVDFSDANFGKGNVDFSDANFGKGNVDFSDAKFGKGDVNFNRAIFGEKEECSDQSSVTFTDATFGEGNISFLDTQLGQNATVFFDSATFGNGRVSFRYSEVVNGGISFSEVVFGEGEVCFSDAKFGNGQVNFSDAKFGNDRVDFTSAELGNRKVTFDKAEFGDRGVCFCDVDFCKANTNTINGVVTFKEVTFGKGAVDFEHAKFGKGTVNFYKSSFGDGDVNFKDAKFGEGNVYFEKVKFGKGNVDFFSANFGEGDVDFGKAEFGKGDVDFGKAEFGAGDVNFRKAKFGEGYVNFGEAEFGEGNVFFDSCEFKGNISFRELQDVKKLSSFSLRNSIFNKSLDMPDNIFNCIPDLTNTKLTNQVSLDRMEISDNYPPKGDFDKSDGERLCRLKELAEANKSYQQALDFHVIEMRAKRYNTKLINGKTLHRWLDTLFDIVCLYGQSIIRPVLSLIGLTIVCAWIYAYESSLDYFPFCYGLLYSVSQVFSFVPAGRSITIGIRDKLFPCETIIPDGVYFFSLLQGVLSFVLLFLIGLGFRNRFRL